MGKPDKLKTAKRCMQAIEQATDGYHQIQDSRKAQRKERQKGKKVIKEEWNENPLDDSEFLKKFVKKYGKP